MIANAAAVYAGYGEPTRFLWAMNGSPLSRSLLEDLDGQGIDTSLVVLDARLADSRNIIVLADGEHTVLTPVLGLDTIQLTDLAFAALCDARYVYTAIGDLRSLRHGGRGARSVIDDVRAAGALLVLDIDVGALRPGDDVLVGAADILLANRLGFERLRGSRTEAEAVRALLAGAASTVVVTLGPGGCRVFSAAGTAAVPGLRVEPVDVTGAGDTFGASFIHALNTTDDPVAAATFANAAAARAVTLVGGRAGVAGDAVVRAFARQHGVLNLPNSPPRDAAPAPHEPAGSPPRSERHAR
jgi:sugar/nucleoside kinase (ribokinase family)